MASSSIDIEKPVGKAVAAMQEAGLAKKDNMAFLDAVAQIKSKCDGIVDSIHENASAVVDQVSSFVDSVKNNETVNAVSGKISDAADMAGDAYGAARKITDDALHSQNIKDAVAAAAVGAVIAVPLPVIGPVIGAAIGGAIGLYREAERSASPDKNSAKVQEETTPAEQHNSKAEELHKLFALKEKGALTEEEYAAEKKKILDGTWP